MCEAICERADVGCMLCEHMQCERAEKTYGRSSRLRVVWTWLDVVGDELEAGVGAAVDVLLKGLIRRP